MRPIRPLSRAVGCLAVAAAVGLLSLPLGAQTRIEEVVVTATRMPRALEDVAGTVSVVDSEALERRIADDLDDVVRYQPGVTMDTAGRGGNQGFVIRGIGGNRVLTLVDGVRGNDSYDAVVSGYGKDVFEIDDLKSIEIIRGPASVLYGADAMGGAVLLRTKDPDDYIEDGERRYFGAHFARSSANDQNKLGLEGAARGDRWSTLFRYTGREFGERELDGDVRLNPLDGRSDDLLVKTVLDLGERNELKLAIDAFSQVVDSRLDTDLSPSVSRSAGGDATDRRRISLDHRWRGDAVLADEIETQAYWQTTDALEHTEQRRTSYSFIDPADFTTYGGTEAERISDFEFNQKVRGLGVTLSKSLATGGADHSVVYGLSLEQTDTERPRNRCDTEIATGGSTCRIAAYPFADPEVFPNRTFPDTATRRTGVFVQGEIIPGDGRIAIIPGVRYDRYEMDPNQAGLVDVTAFGFGVASVDEHDVSVDLGLVVDAGDHLAFFAQYAEGFRPPNYDESNQAFVNRAFGYATIPNPDLRPETSQGLEVGLKTSGDRSRFSVALYRNRYTDFIQSRFVGEEDGISLFQDANVGSARIEGLEFTALWLLSDRWQLHGSLAYSRGDDEQNDVPLDAVDPLTSVLGFRFTEPQDRWSVETLLTLVSAQDRVSAADRATADAYGVVDVVGQVRIADRSTVRIGVYNLLDETYARWANIRGLAASDTDAIGRAREPGTGLRMSMDLRF